jgi:glyoxylase-like metal-dependent hydrolase (beta-lactamase superfamily II)
MRFDVDVIKGGIVNAYLIRGRRIALVDTLVPAGWNKLLKALGSARLSVGDIEFILMTHSHFDHCGNLARLKELSGAVVIAGAEDAPVIEGVKPVPPPSELNRVGRFLGKLPPRLLESYQKCEFAKVDRVVSGGELVEELGLEVVAVPGHTPGGIAYYDREGGRAFIGDMVSNYFSRPGMPTLSASDSLEDILASQEALAALGLETAYPGHGSVLEPGASQAIRRLFEKRRAAAAS